MSGGASDTLTTRAVFTDPVVELAALCPLCALAALNPTAALAALSPVLRTYNPAINPAAAMLAFSLSPAGMSALLYARIRSRLTGLQLVRAGLQMLFR